MAPIAATVFVLWRSFYVVVPSLTTVRESEFSSAGARITGAAAPFHLVAMRSSFSAPIEPSSTAVHSRSPVTPAGTVSTDQANGYFPSDVAAHPQLLSGAAHSTTINWGCPPLPLACEFPRYLLSKRHKHVCAYSDSLDVKPITDSLNGSYSSVISTSSADSIAIDGAIMSDAAYTGTSPTLLLSASDALTHDDYYYYAA